MDLRQQPARRLAKTITRCPLALSALSGSSNACSGIVRSQAAQDGRWQLPIPWLGHIQWAPILFLSSNPAYGSESSDPRIDWDPGEAADWCEEAFENGAIHEGRRPLQPDGTYSYTVRYWSWCLNRAEDLLERLPRPGVDYALTEVVRCHSNDEVGVYEAAPECVGRYLLPTLACSPARVIVVVGKHARDHLASMLGRDVPLGRLVGPITLEGSPRLLIALAHPAGSQSPKAFAGMPDAVSRLRAWLKQAIQESPDQMVP